MFKELGKVMVLGGGISLLATGDPMKAAMVGLSAYFGLKVGQYAGLFASNELSSLSLARAGGRNAIERVNNASVIT